MITVLIHLSVRRGKQTELLQAFEDLSRKIAGETGCISCTFYQSPENTDELVVIQEWKDEILALAHLESENLTVLVGATSVLTKKVNVVTGTDLATRNLKQCFEDRMVKLESF